MSEMPLATMKPSAVPAGDLEPAVVLLVNAIVGKHGTPAPLDAVDSTIEAMRPAVAALYPKAADPVVYRGIAARAMTQVSVDIAPPVVLAPDFEPWFQDAVTSGDVRLDRWYSYKQFLTHSKNFAPGVLDSLDQASSEVVDLLGDPKQAGSWKRRGLVIGDVQSGKTATYLGVVNKAADAGYKLVVLLTGGTESLRRQTQYRVDEGFLGKDSVVVGHDKILGVGRYPTATQFLRGQGMTTQFKDFVAASLKGQAVHIDPNADHPYVFVIKKNKTPLANLIDWLSGQFNGERFDIPMLVVDDESDYASVNTNYRQNGDQNPTLINQKIRELLALTTRSSYMAFTATPFANVFIDHKSMHDALQDDLFPHHYIFALASPTNYVGAVKYFGTPDEAIESAIVDITDADEVFPAKHKSHLDVAVLPPSMESAISAFVVASAVRLVRGDKTPRSMLINVSRFKHVQAQVHELVSQHFAVLKSAIEIHAQPPVRGEDTHKVLRMLRSVFEEHYPECGSEWRAVRNKLFEAVFDTTVELVNSSRNKESDEKQRNMIAVGGDVLSRGLTLDGLTVSYFYRLVGSADTLLQMARWFGYRPGYEDLVRVWIAPETADQFRFVHDVSEELRDQVREMRDLGRRPEDFGLMVRKHPETLAITAKRGVSEAKSMVISLAGRRIETTRIPASRSILSGNQNAVRSFVAALESDDPRGDWRLEGTDYRGKRGVSRERIADLLRDFRYDRGNLILANSLHKLIRDQRGEHFQDWTVVLVGGSGRDLRLSSKLTLPSTPKRAVRYTTDDQAGTFRVSGSSARLAGPTDLGKTFPREGPPLDERDAFEVLPHPTLMIYALEPDLAVKPKDDNPATLEAAERESARAEAAWSAAAGDDVTRIMALKIAIQGKRGSNAGDVQYLLNGPAIDEFAQDFMVSEDDEVDLDE